MKRLSIVLGLFALMSCGEVQKQPMNVLFIAVDDLRPELGCYGAEHIQSPNIDALATEGTVFNRAFCNVPVCGASRASLLSGLRPTQSRFKVYNTRKDEQAGAFPSIPAHLKQNGYQTISLGKVYHIQNDDSLAWDKIWRNNKPHNNRDYALAPNIAQAKTNKRHQSVCSEIRPDDGELYNDEILSKQAIATLDQLNEGDQPFFLAVGFWKPHLPFNAPKRFWDLYDPNEIDLPEGGFNPETAPEQAFHNFGELRNYKDIPGGKHPLPDSLARHLIHGYYACVSFVDAQIGQVLDHLKATGMDKNTMVVLWGDHGWNLRDHGLWCKHSNFTSSTRSSLIINLPEKQIQYSDQIVEFVDIYPTLTELLALPKPKHLQGDSFARGLTDEDWQSDGVAISNWEKGISLINKEYVYTSWIDENGQTAAQMLYDANKDAKEQNNLAPTADPELIQSLQEQIKQHLNTDYFDRLYTEAQP
ncbi:sulfatase [Persicobacter diffluens]|uniref:Iduronate-2-sulfatase n=1 Tax=Persicobacter diffluens TaxID=981 RepID=A0AAN4W3R1_9BACT|nr:iduronate-2-sulfatase [Persicobacter diffluens]